MKVNLDRKGQSIVPFLMLGIAIALCIGLFILFSYVILWGLVLGAVLWTIDWVRRYFFAPKPPKKEPEGRVIEHDEHHQ